MSLPPIIQVGDVLFSSELFTECFCCDLEACKGECCVDGDSGAPLRQEEVAELENVLPAVLDDLSPEAKDVIEKQGVAYVDVEGDLVTSIVGGKDCVFTCRDTSGCTFCATEKAFRAGKTTWSKPISCYLYPLREKRFRNGLFGLTYHRWDVCKSAVAKGRALGLPLYEFLRDPLIRRFGEAWYEELLETYEQLKVATEGEK